MTYDKYIVAFSGGKDSTAIFLDLLDQGISKDKIELWHHCVDGYQAKPKFMDWECTESYCEKFAEAFGVPIYFSWKEGGFKREMLRDNTPTAPTWFFVPKEEYIINPEVTRYLYSEESDGSLQYAKYPYVMKIGGKGSKGTRKMFPQVSGDLRVRWCSAYLKRDVCESAIKNQKRFLNKKIALLTGERGEESSARAKYAGLEPDHVDNRKGGKAKRYVDRIRPIKNWTEKQVWEIIERYKVNVHPCYHIGWGRCSCKFCIFANANQVSTGDMISPDQFEDIASYEYQFGKTIKRTQSMWDLLQQGKDYDAARNKSMANVATSYDYVLPILLEQWKLPAGAYGESAGPS